MGERRERDRRAHQTADEGLRRRGPHARARKRHGAGRSDVRPRRRARHVAPRHDDRVVRGREGHHVGAHDDGGALQRVPRVPDIGRINSWQLGSSLSEVRDARAEGQFGLRFRPPGSVAARTQSRPRLGGRRVTGRSRRGAQARGAVIVSMPERVSRANEHGPSEGFPYGRRPQDPDRATAIRFAIYPSAVSRPQRPGRLPDARAAA